MLEYLLTAGDVTWSQRIEWKEDGDSEVLVVLNQSLLCRVSTPDSIYYWVVVTRGGVHAVARCDKVVLVSTSSGVHRYAASNRKIVPCRVTASLN